MYCEEGNSIFLQYTRMTNCTISWDTFDGDIPDSLIHIFIVYCYAVCFVGLVCESCWSRWTFAFDFRSLSQSFFVNSLV